MRRPHVLALPFPAQGHVVPLLELSQCLVKHGFRVTFVNTDYIHQRIVNALLGQSNSMGDHIELVSIPDGMEPGGDRNDIGKLTESTQKVMPEKLEELIKNINRQEEGDGTISCVLADGVMGWAMEVAEKMNIRRAAFWTSAAGILVTLLRIQELLDDGIVDNDGAAIKREMIQFAPAMPAIHSTDLVWTCVGDFTTQKIIFDAMCKNNDLLKKAEWMVCNSTYELEQGALALIPQLLPVGPLLASNRLGNSAGFLWAEDSSCLKWLDQQRPNSVIYVAFGSFTVFDRIQFQELALGLELTNRPFLWVVRPDITSDDSSSDEAYPEGFHDRVASGDGHGRGRMVGWAPQQKVLSHPSVGCFMSHCGWNSTMEGISNGVPFLCWPYFADQFLNESYICDIWKVGLRFARDQQGIITREEIKDKVDRVMAVDVGDQQQSLKASAVKLKERTLNCVATEEGRSNKILKDFTEWMKS